MKKKRKPYARKDCSTTGRKRDVPSRPIASVRGAIVGVKYPPTPPELFENYYFRAIDADGPVPER
jgi:hypothetical protein